jgi:NADH-quinone oxidoreductase subunit C
MADRLEKGLGGLEAGPSPTEVGAGRPEAAGSNDATVAALRGRFGDAVLRGEVQAGDETVVFVAPSRVFDVLKWLHDDPAQAFDLLKDVTAVDYGGGRPLQVVYELWSISRARQLRVKAELPLDALEVASAVPIWKAADWLEREVYDMFGILFSGHPDLRRILMPENYAEGHPLRKDFPLRGRFSRAEQTRRALSLSVEDFYVPAELEVAERVRADVERESGGGSSIERNAAAADGAGDEDRAAP